MQRAAVAHLCSQRLAFEILHRDIDATLPARGEHLDQIGVVETLSNLSSR